MQPAKHQPTFEPLLLSPQMAMQLPTTMAADEAANPIYHDPTPDRTRTRRSSSRKSFASPISRSTSNLDSPRAIVPKDGDAFSYDPAHLRAWFLPQELWDRLPAELRSSLAAVQHSGAAVLTGKFVVTLVSRDRDAIGYTLRNLSTVHVKYTCDSRLTSIRIRPPRQAYRGRGQAA